MVLILTVWLFLDEFYLHGLCFCGLILLVLTVRILFFLLLPALLLQ
jgi:hypothetical protein